MGVIDPIPDDLMGLYGDDYYGGPQGNTSPVAGYADYAYTAEHGVAWAAALVRLLRPAGGHILDIGCADGRLLAKLGPEYVVSGIEANKTMGLIAKKLGISILGQDLLDPIIVEEFAGRFDVVTAIAVFEHIRGIRAGLHAAMRLLRDDGVLLFEVPLISELHDNTTWFTSSLEHVWYPSEQSLRHLVEIELCAEMEGVETYITGYASTYIGLVFRRSADGSNIRDVAARVLLPEGEPISADEAIARMLLHVVHRATRTHADIGVLAELPANVINPQLLRRFAELWQADLYQLQQVRTQREAEQMQARCLQADLDAAESDRVRSNTELTASLVAYRARLLAMQKKLDAEIAERRKGPLITDIDRQTIDRRWTVELELVKRSEQKAIDRALAAETRLVAIESDAAGRMGAVVRRLAQRYPRLNRFGRRTAHLLRWTLRGQPVLRILANIAPRRIEPLSVDETGSAEEHSLSSSRPFLEAASPIVLPADALGVLPLKRSPLVVRDIRGHRPELPGRPTRQDCWPLVSVVITSFNYGQFVAAAVNSALEQTFKDLEVVVVEGGSSDPNSRFVVAELRSPRTRVLMQGEPHWAGANRNYGISQARGRYICCLDADDTLAPTYIEKAVFLLERHGYDVVSSAMEMVGDEQRQVNVMEKPDLESLLNGNQVLTCAVFRRSLWDKAGGYRDIDSTISGYVYEDWAFWVRLAALGARFRNLHHDPMLRYRVHGDSLSRGRGIPPMSRQRQMVWQVNSDVLRSVTEKIVVSRRQAIVRSGTPSAPPAPIILNRQRQDTKSPTLLLAMPFLILGGAEKLLSDVVAHLVRVGWRVVIITSIDPGVEHGDTTSWFEPHTSEIFHLARGFPPDLWEDFLHHLVRSRAVDVLWVVGSVFAYDCLRGLKAVYRSLRVADLLFNTVAHTANNRRRRELIDLNFVENGEVRDWLLARGETTKRIKLIQSGVDLTALQPMARSEVLLRQIGAASGDLIVGFSGRWSEEKNPIGFVDIARMVDSTLPVYFVATGTGHLRSAIEHAIREARFREGRFHLLGEVPEIAPVLASFDLLVVPSTLDGRPLVVLEAMALGVPVLASRVGALPELVQEGRTGWLCAPNAPRAFAECIEMAERDRAGLRQMRRQAREYAEANLGAQRMLDAYTEGLATLLPEGRYRN